MHESNLNELLPTAEDVRFYNEHGYYLSKKIFSDEEIDAAVNAMDEIYTGRLRVPESGPFKNFKLNWNFGEGLRKTDYASFFNPSLALLVRKPILAQIAAILAGSTVIRLWHDQRALECSGHRNLQAAASYPSHLRQHLPRKTGPKTRGCVSPTLQISSSCIVHEPCCDGHAAIVFVFCWDVTRCDSFSSNR